MKKRLMSLLLVLALAAGLLTGCQVDVTVEQQAASGSAVQSGAAVAVPEGEFSLAEIPPYTDAAYVEVNGNHPYFTEEEKNTQVFENYSELDELGRCGVAYANICKELMPTEKRGDIHSVKPSGWHSVQYDCVDGKSLYNRCHLIGFQLAGENANKENLITGTRYLNVIGMLPFENLVADYVKETDAHVLYRVTPVYERDELVARGVLMEGWSVEDEGDGVEFCVFAYNVQPGITIDYATGESYLSDGDEPEMEAEQQETYILNVKSKKFHRPGCSGAEKTSAENKQEFTGSRQQLLDQGYEPCGICKP